MPRDSENDRDCLKCRRSIPASNFRNIRATEEAPAEYTGTQPGGERLADVMSGPSACGSVTTAGRTFFERQSRTF